MWYRCEKDFTQEEVLKLADEFRQRKMPCDVIGLEPGWQTNAYSCSFVWSKKFPDPKAMIGKLEQSHYKLNLWEHAFTHPSSPIHKALMPHSGDYEVWGGIVPDFLDPAGRKIFADFQEKEHVSIGVSGYKLDECDNSDFTGNWSFPELAKFPSGADGEQMHTLFGLRYQDAIQGIFDRRKQRTYGLVRSAHALAAPYPYVLYSDLYEHAEFIKAVAKMGLSGLLWTPELRNAQDMEDLIRRLQAVALSPMALINAWYIKNPPWKQVERRKNNAGELDPNWEDLEKRCRAVMEMRMRFVPYLHAAFVQYHKTGLPPFRPLVMDWPADAGTWAVDSQYMMGEGVMVAPVVAGERERSVYLPEGEWFEYQSEKRFSGKQRIRVAVPLEQIPIFVKSGTLLPLAQPTLHTEEDGAFVLSVKAYGQGPASCSVYEEEGMDVREVKLTWDGSRPFIAGARRYRLAT
jgi:alpha-D-xyloside xylohydrolase